jgi:prophage tail gpP-like protein
VPNLELKVNGRAYGGWKSVRVTRGIEAVAGSFELSVSDRWGVEDKPRPIFEEDECSVAIDGVPVITGYVDTRAMEYDGRSHSFAVEGRDKTGDLVDCDALLDKWEFRNVPVLTLAKKVAEPYGIDVTLQAGVIPPKPPAKFTVDPGDSAFEVIERSCRLAALLPVSDGLGGLVLTRAGSGRAVTALVEGQNILSVSGRSKASGRYRHYFVLGQHRGSDALSGSAAASIKAFAEDQNVVRVARTKLIRPEGNVTVEHAKKRAEWEATVAAARSDTYDVTVQGWQQSDGSLWPVNAHVRVRSPFLGVDGDLLITSATYSLNEGGTTTQLTLKRPDSFKPEPVVTKGSTALWKEIARGV